MMKTKPALYIHVPFCAHLCHYCDFCHVIYREEKAKEWLSAFERELRERLDFIPQTIYIGGGTPTALSSENLRHFFELIKEYMQGQECTIEINPETFSSEKASLLKEYGINRASIGVQSTDEEELKFLGRHHTFQQVEECCRLLKDVEIDNYSIDILYSFPRQTMTTFRRTMHDVFSLYPKHISLYSLTVEKNTPFARRGYQPFDEDKEADFYEFAVKMLEERGYEQYEVANFAKAGYRSQHNQVYWHYDDFLGLSMGASSKMNHERSDNTVLFSEYLQGEWIKRHIPLTPEEEEFEFLMMNLRLKEGFAVSSFNERFSVSLEEKYAAALEEGFRRNWLCRRGDRLCVADREILHEVLLLFMD